MCTRFVTKYQTNGIIIYPPSNTVLTPVHHKTSNATSTCLVYKIVVLTSVHYKTSNATCTWFVYTI